MERSEYRWRLVWGARVLAGAGLVMAGCVLGGLGPARAEGGQVSACKLTNAAAVSALFGGVQMVASDVAGPRGGTCFFDAATPHIEVALFYAPVANVAMYGFGPNVPDGETAVPGLGDAALYRQSNAPSEHYANQGLTVMKGTAVVDVSIDTDKALPPVDRAKLVAFMRAVAGGI